MLAIPRLARWLGPWADSAKAPAVDVHDDELDGMRVRIYGKRRRRARTFLIAPGLHYAGPDDPRMDRFCRILAAAGHLVVAPFIPAYVALMPDQTAIADFAKVAAALPRWTDSPDRPVVFSISFGSLLAFALAAEYPDAVDRLVIFGGYSDFHETMRFCLTGEVTSGRIATRDPLNQPVVIMNLLDIIEFLAEESRAKERVSLADSQHASIPCPRFERSARDELVAGWRRYVERTWGRVEMKADRRFVAVAEELAPMIPEPVRELFLIGIGALPGATELAATALERFDARPLDPTPYLPRVTCRVDLVHGTDDDVIPFEMSHELGRRLVNADARVHITGLYGHTGSQRPPLSALARELSTMLRVLRAMA